MNSRELGAIPDKELLALVQSGIGAQRAIAMNRQLYVDELVARYKNLHKAYVDLVREVEEVYFGRREKK